MWTLCKTREGGDLVDWRTASWEARGLLEVQLESQEVCKERKGRLLVLDTQRDFDDTLYLARMLGGEVWDQWSRAKESGDIWVGGRGEVLEELDTARAWRIWEEEEEAGEEEEGREGRAGGRRNSEKPDDTMTSTWTGRGWRGRGWRRRREFTSSMISKGIGRG